ncbi:hypothetical protein ACT41J_13965 [Acinetobacter baumannii]
MKIMYKGDVLQLIKDHDLIEQLNNTPEDHSVTLLYQDDSSPKGMGICFFKFCHECRLMLQLIDSKWEKVPFTNSNDVIDHIENKLGKDSVIPAYTEDLKAILKEEEGASHE